MAESVPPPRGPASGPVSGTAPTQPGAPPTQRSPSGGGHAPPTQHSPSPMAESVPPPRGAPGPASGTAPTQPGLPPTQRPPSGTAPTQPGVPPTQRPASGTAPTLPGQPPTQRPASGTAPTLPGQPPTQRPASGTAPTQPGHPPTERAQSPQPRPMTPADQRVQPHTERHLDARRQEIEAAKRLQQNPTEANRKAYEAAEAATKDAAFAEQAEFRRQGGEGLPPGLRPGAREPLPGTPAPSPMAESVSRPQAPAPAPGPATQSSAAPTQASPSPMAESVPPPRADAAGPATQQGVGRAPTGTLPGIQPGSPPAQRGVTPQAQPAAPSTLPGVGPRAGPLGTAPTQPRLPPMQQLPAGRAGTPPSGPVSAGADTVKGGKPDTLREPFGRSPDTQRVSPMADSVPAPPNTVRGPVTQPGVAPAPGPTTLPGVGPSRSAQRGSPRQAGPLGTAPARTAADSVPPTQRSPNAAHPAWRWIRSAASAERNGAAA